MKDYTVRRWARSDKVSERKREKSKPVFLSFVVAMCSFGGVFVFALSLAGLPSYVERPLNPGNVGIIGNRNVKRESVIGFLNVDASVSWFDLSPYTLSSRLKRHTWVNKALIHRAIPFGLRISLSEREPISFLKTRRHLFLLGYDNMVLDPIPATESWDMVVIVDNSMRDVFPGATLPKIKTAKAFELIELLRKSETLPLSSVSEIDITDPLNIQLTTMPYGIKIKLGFEEFDRKLLNLRFALKAVDKNRNRLDYIDLRYDHGLVIRRKR